MYNINIKNRNIKIMKRTLLSVAIGMIVGLIAWHLSIACHIPTFVNPKIFADEICCIVFHGTFTALCVEGVIAGINLIASIAHRKIDDVIPMEHEEYTLNLCLVAINVGIGMTGNASSALLAGSILYVILHIVFDVILRIDS